MDKAGLTSYLEKIDRELKSPTVLCVYGSGALILMDEPGRTSLDLDIASPYSIADYKDLEQAAKSAGLPLNPPEDYQGDHIEWIPALRLCLSAPDPLSMTTLWRGRNLTLTTVSPAQLVASKLIRYDEIDQADILFLCTQARVTHVAVEAAVRKLPPPFDTDSLVLENLANLKVDLKQWEGGDP